VHSPPDFHAVDVFTNVLGWVVAGVAVLGGLLLAVALLKRRWEDGAFARPHGAAPDGWSGAARTFARATITCAAEAGVVWLLALTLGRWTDLVWLFDFSRDALAVLAAVCMCVAAVCQCAAAAHRRPYSRGR